MKQTRLYAIVEDPCVSHVSNITCQTKPRHHRTSREQESTDDQRCGIALCTVRLDQDFLLENGLEEWRCQVSMTINGLTDGSMDALFSVSSYLRKTPKANKRKYLSLIMSLRGEMHWRKMSLSWSLWHPRLSLCSQLASAAGMNAGLALKASSLLVTVKAKQKSFTRLPVCHKLLLPLTADVRIWG